MSKSALVGSLFNFLCSWSGSFNCFSRSMAAFSSSLLHFWESLQCGWCAFLDASKVLFGSTKWSPFFFSTLVHFCNFSSSQNTEGNHWGSLMAANAWLGTWVPWCGGILVWIVCCFWCFCWCWLVISVQCQIIVVVWCWIIGRSWFFRCPVVKIRCHLAWLLCPWCMRIVKHSMGFVIWIVLFVWLVWVHCCWSDVLLTGSNFCHWPNNDVFPECPTPALQRGDVPLPAFPPTTNFGFQWRVSHHVYSSFWPLCLF